MEEKELKYIATKTLELRLKALLLLDEIMTPPEHDYLRIINSGNDGQVLWYIIDNGSGDSLMILFINQDVFIKGFDHESELNQFAAKEWDNEFFTKIFAGVPDNLMKLLTKEERDETTFCMWYLSDVKKWHENKISDNDGGKSWLLRYIPQSADQFLEWAEDYYGKSFNSIVMEKLFNSAELSANDKAILKQ